MSKYQEFQQKVKAICNASDYYSSDVIAQKYYSLLAEVLDEFKKLEAENKSDREGLQDWDGGEEKYRAYQKEFWIDEIVEDEEEVIDDDENC